MCFARSNELEREGKWIKASKIIISLLIHSHAACLWDEAKKFDSHRDVKLSRIVAAADFSCSECSELFLMKCGSLRGESGMRSKWKAHFPLFIAFSFSQLFQVSLPKHNVMKKKSVESFAFFLHSIRNSETLTRRYFKVFKWFLVPFCDLLLFVSCTCRRLEGRTRQQLKQMFPLLKKTTQNTKVADDDCEKAWRIMA